MKKRIACGIIALSILATSFAIPSNYDTAYAAMDSRVNVLINGEKINSNIEAYIKDSRTIIPLRVVMENLGANVQWDAENNAVDISKGNRNVRLYIDNRLIKYNDNGITSYDVSDVAPILMNNLTYVPIRLVSTALGYNVTWNEAKRQVDIYDGIVDNTEKATFFDIDISNISNGEVISGKKELKLSNTDSLPKNAKQLRYLFLNPTSGTGKIIAQTTDIKSPITLLPDINNQGEGVLAAIICDEHGNFVAGTAKAIKIAIKPDIKLVGVKSGETLQFKTPLSCELNFAPAYIRYEIHYPNRDLPIYISPETDPMGSFGYVPEKFENGEVAIRAAVYDSNDNPYYSDFVNVKVNAYVAPPKAPYVTLSKISTENVGIIPVKLSISRNFSVSKTQYYAKNKSTNKTVLLHENVYGDYSWFPGPDMAGDWDIYVKCTASDGKIYTSNSRTVTVPRSPSITISGIGPNQVITGEFKLRSISNVPLKQVTYTINNPNNGTQRIIGITDKTDISVSFVPTSINEGTRNIQAVGLTEDNKKVFSEQVPIKIFLGEIYGSRPLVEKSQFIDYVTNFALETQKENGMSAALQIAQAILETGWGQSIPVDKYNGTFSNNLFGIKGKGNAGSVLCNTWEEYYGTLYRIDDHFRAYKSVKDSWDDHNALLTTRERYIPYTKVMYNSTAGAYALKRCGYATDSKYPGKLINIIHRYDLDKLDNQKI